MKLNPLARAILSPFALLYGLGISIRNGLYESKLIKPSKFNVPVIGIGNLSMGGAGKTPHVEYLVRLLKDYVNIGVISRGYKRQTKGLRKVTPQSRSKDVGDEPLMYSLRFGKEISVFVAENRNLAIPQILQKNRHIDCFLLDDAFQHRAVLPGLNILLTPFQLPYTRDYLLPMGRLREWSSEAQRAEIIVVTKCPPNLSKEEKDALRDELEPEAHQLLVFSEYKYNNPYNVFNIQERKPIDNTTRIYLLSAIANTDYLLEYLVSKTEAIMPFEYEDHHYFSRIEVENLVKTFNADKTANKMILTTEKDAVRLFEHAAFFQQNNVKVFALPVQVSFFPEDKLLFDSKIRQFMLDFKI